MNPMFTEAEKAEGRRLLDRALDAPADVARTELLFDWVAQNSTVDTALLRSSLGNAIRLVGLSASSRGRAHRLLDAVLTSRHRRGDVAIGFALIAWWLFRGVCALAVVGAAALYLARGC